MKIEKLEPSRHRQGRWLVWLEDGSLVRLGEGEVVSLSLYSGKELTEEEGEALAAAEIQGRLNERAVALRPADVPAGIGGQAVRPGPPPEKA